MKRACLTAGVAVTLLLNAAGNADANDLIEFLKAVQQVSDYARHSSHGPSIARRHSYGSRYHDHGLSSRDIYKQRLLRTEAFARQGLELPYESQLRLHEPDLRGAYLGRSNLYRGQHGLVTVNYGHGRPQEVAPAPRTPVPPAPVPRYQVLGSPLTRGPIAPVSPLPANAQIAQQPVEIFHAPHQIGEIVDCPVPLETCIRIKDPDHIAPDAIPVVIAVRDPNLCRHKCKCCVERVVYIEVCLPPCPPRRMRISPCKTYVCLNYGKYQVELTSRKGLITIDYDD